MLHTIMLAAALAASPAATPAVAASIAAHGAAATAHADDARAPIHRYESLDLSPDGTRIAAVESLLVPASGLAPRGPVVVRSAAGRVLWRFDPCPSCRYGSVAWSPDGTRLAFLATDEKLGRVIVEIAAAGRVATLVTLTGVANTLRWAPDGKSIALLATLGAKKMTGALEAGAPQVGEIGEKPDEQRIAVVDTEAAGPHALRMVSPADTFVYEYDWTPDGRGFVATAAKGDGDDNWWVAELDAIDLAAGHSRTIARPSYQIAAPRVAPDGKSVAFIGGLMSDFGVVGGDIYDVPFDGGTPVNRTEKFRGSFTSLLWRSGHLYASAIVVDRNVLFSFDSTPRERWSAPVSATAGDSVVAVAADGVHGATVVEDFGTAPRIISGRLDAMHPITHDNDTLNIDLDARSVQWKSDGFDVQGWLIGPAHLKPAARYPMIVHVHGGPSAAVMPSFGGDYSLYTTVHEWVQLGYFFFMPNPRGSYGQGEAFTRADIRDFGGGDLRDILAGVDAALEVAPIDGERVGLHGHSYGGFMAMWAVTHTHRFKVAVAGAGLSNWISYYGENGIDQWMIPFFGASAYDDPAIYRAASPIESIKQARTPTLIYVGELDVECPAPQSFEFWHGLKAMGVHTELMVYPGEGHLIRRPAHILDLRRRLPEWFGRYLEP